MELISPSRFHDQSKSVSNTASARVSFGGVGCFDGSGLSLYRWLSFAYRLKYRARSKDSRKIAEYGVAYHKGKFLVLSHVSCP